MILENYLGENLNVSHAVTPRCRARGTADTGAVDPGALRPRALAIATGAALRRPQLRARVLGRDRARRGARPHLWLALAARAAPARPAAGARSHGVYETPGGTILHAAHRAVESLTLDREVMHLRDSLMPRFAELIYNGYWYSPEMDLLKGMVVATQENVTGTARLKLYKGGITVAGRKSPVSLYRTDFATFEKEAVFNQADATGFIKINALRLKIRSMLKSRKG